MLHTALMPPTPKLSAGRTVPSWWHFHSQTHSKDSIYMLVFHIRGGGSQKGKKRKWTRRSLKPHSHRHSNRLGEHKCGYCFDGLWMDRARDVVCVIGDGPREPQWDSVWSWSGTLEEEDFYMDVLWVVDVILFFFFFCVMQCTFELHPVLNWS